MSLEDLKLLAQALKESKDRDHYAVVDRRVLKQAVRELGDMEREVRKLIGELDAVCDSTSVPEQR